MAIKIFVQNEAGSSRKYYHDEKTVVWQRSVEVYKRVGQHGINQINHKLTKGR